MTTKERRPIVRAGDRPKPWSRWELYVYVARGAPRSAQAIANLKRLCQDHGPGRYRIHVVDVLKVPGRCQKDQVIAVPTVVRRLPLPERRVIGTLQNADAAAAALGLNAGNS